MIYKDWDAMGSDISKLETFDDDEQPLPQNVREHREGGKKGGTGA